MRRGDGSRVFQVPTASEPQPPETASPHVGQVRSKRDFPLPWDTAPGRTVSSIDGEYSTPTLRLAMWPAFAGG